MAMTVPVHAGQAAQATAPRAVRAGQQPSAPQEPPVDLLWRTDGTDERSADRLFSLAGLNLGVDQDGDTTFAGRGHFLVRFGGRSAFQIEGTYDGYHGHRDGQLDMGLVNRVKRVQLGLFTSVRYVDLDAYDRGVSVSQFGAAFDYVFRTGQVGLFGAAGLQDTEGLGPPRLSANDADNHALHLVDQFGASAQVGVSDRVQVQGHLSFLNPTCQGRTTAGSIRLIYPMTADWALTAEGAWNPSLVDRSTQARFMVGARMGHWPSSRPSPSDDRPVPIEMLPIRYQTLRAGSHC
jgi:hypothetical protein